MHIHLDLLGGLAGDMFIGAVLDCCPELYDDLPQVLVQGGFEKLVRIERSAYDDGVLTGTLFSVIADEDAKAHNHRHFSEIRSIIEDSSLPGAVRQRAIDIFTLLAEAEGAIHGKDPERVAFHEVGAWDSIADVICTAHLIEQLGATRWSVSSLPLGRGRVKTAHGLLPVPTPATALLLQDFQCHDDGVEGERITPTGAAILKYLRPDQQALGPIGRIVQSGYGFGTKRFPGLSNVVRITRFETTNSSRWQRQQVLQINFEIDDQTAEELSVALERLRLLPGVLDVQQSPSLGKKNRQFAAIQILADPPLEEDILAACFDQTTTIGVRTQVVNRSILRRESITVNAAGRQFRAKRVERPGGSSVKAEMDDLSSEGGTLFELKDLRQHIEASARTTVDNNNDN